MRWRGGSYDSTNPGLEGCIGSALSHSEGAITGIMPDCSNRAVLRFFVNRKEVGSTPIPEGTYFPAFCVHTGQMAITRYPGFPC
jgi:hypothetical protein